MLLFSGICDATIRYVHIWWSLATFKIWGTLLFFIFTLCTLQFRCHHL